MTIDAPGHDSGPIAVAYHAAGQWDITPETLAEVAERARPG